VSYINPKKFDLGAESQDEAMVSTESLERRSAQVQQQLDAMSPSDTPQRCRLEHQLAGIFVELEWPLQAWMAGFPLVAIYLQRQSWEEAVSVCDTLFLSGHEDALVALGHGLWLGITFPVSPMATLAQLQHVIDETPENSDGAAVAAAVAGYVVGLRSDRSGNGEANDDATLVAGQMMNDVARRHGNVSGQEDFDAWFNRLELGDPGKFLVRMRNIIDVLVQDQWWFNRDQLQSLIPE
jgi:hypothetical protein